MIFLLPLVVSLVVVATVVVVVGLAVVVVVGLVVEMVVGLVVVVKVASLCAAEEGDSCNNIQLVQTVLNRVCCFVCTVLHCAVLSVLYIQLL